MTPNNFRNPDIAQGLAAKIAALVDRDIALMEVCGSHTMAIGHHGIRSLLPPRIRLLSGPGCPVCVTAEEDIDRALAIAREHEVIITTFGDMFRVPGSNHTLEEAKAEGQDIRIVYSPAEAVTIARDNPQRAVLFLGVGFETTTPTVAAALQLARKMSLENFHVLPMAKVVPPALEVILSAGKAKVDGFILPGHVGAILGTEPFRFVAEKYGLPGVITGFEPVDILQGILMLVEQLVSRKSSIEIQYTRVVRPEGNPLARDLVAQVYQPGLANWRAIGEIPDSGLTMTPDYEAFDGSRVFPVDVPPAKGHPGCRCGDILMGLAHPDGCPLFGGRCTPGTPVGPCMVSSEGSCAAHFKYGAP